MGYTGKEAMAFKEAYIARFNEMEEALRHTSAAAVTSSLQVAEAFEKQHLHVMRDIREILSKCSQQFGESNFGLSSFQSRQNKEMPMYLLSRDGFMLVVMGYTGDEAMRLKEAWITKFNEMEEALRHTSVPAGLPDFTNPAVAARAWADERERADAVTLALEEAKPKAEFVDRYVEAEGLRTFTQAAKTLKIKRADLISLLLEQHLFRDRRGNIQPYAGYVKSGLYVTKETLLEPTKRTVINTYLTPKGFEAVARIVNQ